MNPRGVTAGVTQKEKPGATFPRLVPIHRLNESLRQQKAPIIDVSESDGAFNVYADFSLMAELSDVSEVTVEFARQGVVITRGTVQRYIPIPTDGEIERATVKNAGGIVRISVPTAGLGHRWRSIIMW